MRRGEAEDAGGLTPVRDDNEAAPHFTRGTLLVFNCFDYKKEAGENEAQRGGRRGRGDHPCKMGFQTLSTAHPPKKTAGRLTPLFFYHAFTYPGR